MKACDVVVVGAGLSGLYCAWRLTQAGLDVDVVEARNRVGGRTLSEPMGAGTFDRGGQWIGREQHRVQALGRDLGLRTFPTHSTGNNLLVASGQATTYTGTVPRIPLVQLAGLGLAAVRLELLSRRVAEGEPWDARSAREIDKRTAGQFAAPLGADAQAVFTAAVRTVFGEEPSAMSLLYFASYTGAGGGLFNLVEVEGGAQEERFVRGAQALSLELAARLGQDHVHLKRPVTAVIDESGPVTVVTKRRTFAAPYVVIALAPPMIKSLRFSPDLPRHRVALQNGMKMGAAIKIVVLYERAFWRDAGLSGEVVYDEPPLSVVFDNTSHDGAQPALVAFIMGDAARQWRDLEHNIQRRDLLRALAQAFGPQANAPIEIIEHDWVAEPFIGGCPTAIFPPGLLSRSGRTLREPHGRVHWAGTETATEYPGYLEGALQAGERAAAEVLAAFGVTDSP